ncbi:peritrophin-44 isoform X1 [Drosophila ficusphila]|uniref:peritrophin-44 isoform X1 n=1 Tax=Drosophila ficusphila TaxID=30025 RepID=UPI0007E7F759|nr:peritrophin-44 isoform X1 [Drosophila ficusphila]
MGEQTFSAGICAVACVLLLASQASGFSYTMEQMCAQISGTGYVGNPSSCRAWGYCENQKLAGWGTCDDGLIFDSQKSSCLPANQTICSTSAVTTCANAKSPMYVADPTNCTQYAWCAGNGTLQYGNCGEGGVYAANNQTCVWGPACPQDDICKFIKSGSYIGDPDNCGSYISCNNGYGTAGSCTKQYYNLATGMCQNANPCDGSSNNDSSGDSSSPFTVGEEVAGVCASFWADAEEAVADKTDQTYRYVSDNTTCYGYFYCANSTASGIWNQCPAGTQFNVAKGQCVSPAAFACKFNRCGNVNRQFMTVQYTGCRSYSICASGVQATCQNDLYYDEINNICTQTRPSYAICTATAPTKG